MELDDKKIKDLYKRMIKNTHLSTKDCLSDELLFKAVENNSDERLKFKVIDHVYKCDTCSNRFNAFRKFHKESKLLVQDKENIQLNKSEIKKLTDKGKEILKSKDNENVIPIPKFQLKYISALAALLIIIFGSILYLNRSSELNNNEKIDVVRGINVTKIQLLSPLGSIKKNKLNFQWKPIEGAESYSVKLYNDELTCIWTSPKTKLLKINKNPGILKKIKSDKIYFWKLFVYFKNKKILKSKLSDFKIIKNNN